MLYLVLVIYGAACYIEGNHVFGGIIMFLALVGEFIRHFKTEKSKWTSNNNR